MIVSARQRVCGGMLAFVAAAVAGCGTSTPTVVSSAGPGMMAGSVGAGMMGDWRHVHPRFSCSAPSSLPSRTVRVFLADMGMHRTSGGRAPVGARMLLRAFPRTVPAGRVTFVAENMGWRAHELVILPLAPGAVDGQRTPGTDGTVSETGSLGEASRSCGPGAGTGINAGTVGWASVTLAPGHYELICNRPNHYVDGMHEELTVT